MQYLRIWLCLFVLVLVGLAPVATMTPQQATAASSDERPSTLMRTGYIGGPSQAVAVRGAYAYVGFGPSLAILRTDRVGDPIREGYLFLSGQVIDVAVDEYFAYVVTDDKRVSVVNVANPSEPFVVATYTAADRIEALAVANGLVLLATRQGLSVLEYASPDALRVVGSLQTFPAYAVAAQGNFVYLGHICRAEIDGCLGGAPDSRLAVIDLSLPGEPKLIQEVVVPGLFITDIALQGSFAYLASWSNYGIPYAMNVSIVDIATPATAALRSSYSADSGGYESGPPALAVEADFVYMGLGRSRVVVVNVADRSHPVGTGKSFGEDLQDVAVADGRLYLAEGSLGLLIYGADAASDAAPIGTYRAVGNAYDVTAADEYIYVTGSGGLRSIAVSDAETPRVAGSNVAGGYGIAVTNKLAVVYNGSCGRGGCSSGLTSYDIRDPADPKGIGYVELDTESSTFGPKRLTTDGNYVYLGASITYNPDETLNGSGLLLIEILESGGLMLKSNYTEIGGATSVAVTGTYALAAQASALHIIDVANPEQPTEISQVISATPVFDVAVRGKYAYLLKRKSLEILDISDPKEPTSVGEMQLDTASRADDDFSAIPKRIVVDEQYAYVALSLVGLEVIDISEPRAPVKVDTYDTPGNAVGVAVSGKQIYVADLQSGLFILKLMDLSRGQAYLPMISH